MPNSRVTENSTQEIIDVCGGSTFGRYSKISAAKTFNMYLSTAGIEKTDNQETWLVGFPGYRRILNLFPFPEVLPKLYPDQIPAGQGRAIFHSVRGNIVIVVVNQAVYALSPTLGQTFVGNLNSAVGEVFIDENLNNQICIVDGRNAYIYNYRQPAPNLFVQTQGAFSPLAPGDPPALVPNYVEYHQSYFLFGNASQETSGSQWYVYEFNDSPSGNNDLIKQVTPGGVFSIQTKPDFARAVKRIPSRASNVLVFGNSVCEVFTFSGGVDNYTINPSMSINYGCQSVSTIAEGADILVWLGVNEDESPVICVYDGDNLKNISTDGIDDLLGSLKAPETSTAILYREEGHLFYILTFYDPRDNLTVMYDFNTGLFSNLCNQDMDFFPARGIVYFNLTTYFVSLRNAALYELSGSINVYNENLPRTSKSSPYNTSLVYDIPRKRITSNIRLDDAGRFIANSLSLTLEQGCDEEYTGLNGVDNLITEATNNPPLDQIVTEFGDDIVDEDSGDSSNGVTAPNYVPRIDLRFSKDGGVTWSNFVPRNLNPLGYRQNQLHWEGMGAANDIVFAFYFWQINRLVVNNATLDIIA